MYCIHCGKKIEHEGQFCIYCGAKIYDEEEAEAEPIEADASLQEEKPGESDSVSEKPVKETAEIYEQEKEEPTETKETEKAAAPIEEETERTIESAESKTGKKRAVVAAIFIAIIVITALIIVIVHFTRNGSGKDIANKTAHYDTLYEANGIENDDSNYLEEFGYGTDDSNSLPDDSNKYYDTRDYYAFNEMGKDYPDFSEDEEDTYQEPVDNIYDYYDYSNPGVGIDSVYASSQLPDEGQYNYDPENLFDGDITTAYVEGVEGMGIGETITITLDNFYLIKDLRIAPGYDSTPEVYEKNSVPTGFNVYYYNNHDEETQETVYIDPVNFGGEYSLFQYYPELADIYMIKIEILDAQPGTRYEDTCISEIYIDGFPRVEE